MEYKLKYIYKKKCLNANFIKKYNLYLTLIFN